MSEAMSESGTSQPESVEATVPVTPSATHPADTPIPLWPEGVIAIIAGLTLVLIGVRHRFYLQRKAREIQRAVDEFQRQGGVEELSHVAQQAAELFKGATA
jgi:hypothetical protein